MNTVAIIDAILRSYALPWYGIHGVHHWGRVLENGLRLAELTKADVKVVTLFALFHDSKRVNEDHDLHHGRRGADFAATLRGSLFQLDDLDFEVLRTACAYHTDGLTEGDLTVQTCWDADRLDLGRVGIRPHPRYLCTLPAKTPEMIAWADSRARGGVVPEVIDCWNLKHSDQTR